MAPKGLLERPIIDINEGSKPETKRALLFGFVATVVIILTVVIGVSGETSPLIRRSGMPRHLAPKFTNHFREIDPTASLAQPRHRPLEMRIARGLSRCLGHCR